MNRKSLYAALAVMMICSNAQVRAQDEEYSQRVEVTRNYVPEIGRTEKLDIQPRMTDPVMLQPEVDYSVTPKMWQTAFETENLPSVGISTAEWNKRYPLYIKAGMAYPLSSLADVYYTPFVWRDGQLVTYFNHSGIEASIKNDTDMKKDALTLKNLLGVNLGKGLRGGMRVEADINYQGDLFTPYGGYSYSDTPITYGSTLRYNTAGGRVVVGHDFTDLTHLNFRAGFSGDYFWHPQSGDNYAQADYGAFMELGGGFTDHRLSVKVAFEAHDGLKAISNYKDTRFSVSPRFSFRPSFLKAMNFDLGVDYIYNDSPVSGRSVILPNVCVSFDKHYEFVPYLSVRGSLGDGSYRSLVGINPYVEAGAWTNNSVKVDYRGGIYGDLSVVKYDLSSGLEDVSRYNYFVNLDASSRFEAHSDAVRIFYVNAKMNFRFTRGLFLNVGGRYNSPKNDKTGNQNLKNLYAGMGIPKFESNISLDYNWGNRLTASVSADILGSVDYATRTTVSVGEGELKPIVSETGYVLNTAPASVNLGIDVSYRISNTVGVFVAGDNLLSDNIYTYNRYPMLGANVMAGVKLNF